MNRFLRLPILMGLIFVMPGLTQADDQAAKSEVNAVARVGETAPDFTLTDASGKEHSLSDFEGKFVVLEWINFECPFVKKHYSTENMQALQQAYAKKDVVWLTICSSAPGKQGYYQGSDLKKALKSHEWQAAAYLLDPTGKVGKMYNAKTTPNMYVIDPEGTLVYAGAIDDKPTVDVADVEGATNYVTAALDAAMADKEVAVKVTQPYGCSVKYEKAK